MIRATTQTTWIAVMMCGASISMAPMMLADISHFRKRSRKRITHMCGKFSQTAMNILHLAYKIYIAAASVMLSYHDLFWRTRLLVPLTGFFSNIHIMIVVAALKLNQVKMYCEIVSLMRVCES